MTKDKPILSTIPKYLTSQDIKVLDDLKENEAGLSTTDIALHIGQKKDTVNHRLRRIYKLGLVTSIRGIPTIYKINPAATLSLRSIMEGLSLGLDPFPSSQGKEVRKDSVRKGVRAHALLFKVNYSGNFNSSLFKDNPEFHDIQTEAKLKNVPIGISGRFKGEYFMINPHSITFQPHAIYGQPEATGFTLFKLAVNFLEILQENHKEIKIDKSIIVLNSQEYAFEKDIFAKLIHALAGNVDTGRWKVDCSKGEPELEFYGKHANDDASLQVQNANDMFTGVLSREIKEGFQSIVSIKEREINITKQKQAHYAKNHPKLLRLIQFLQHSEELTNEAIPTDPKKPNADLRIFEEMQKKNICDFINREYGANLTTEDLR